MKDIKVKDFINNTDSKLLSGSEEEILSNFKKDTREIQKGDTYVGIKGEKVDGNTLYEEALKNGARACIIENIDISKDVLEKYKDKAIIKVENSIEALQKIAKYKREMYDIPVIGITGSVRKN